jgi:Ca2+-binding EF-hand superfamily protein
MFRFTSALVLTLHTVAAAQTLPATRTPSGLDATSARSRIERDGRRPYGPRFEASGMMAAAGVEFFPGLRLPGQKEDFKRPIPPIRVVKPKFKLPESNLGIPDVHDVLFLSESRVVRFRVHLKSAGASLAKRWTGQLRTYFDFLDRDGNGELNKYEAEFAFTNQGVVQMLQSGFAFQRPDDAARTFADIDVDEDTRIHFDEFAAYYSPSAGRIIAEQANPNRDFYAETLTDELIKLFDTDKDGKLSKDELTAVEKLFSTLDSDEDECLAATEIVPNLFNRPIQAPRSPAELRQSPMMAFRPGSDARLVIEAILARYDKNKNGVLNKAENPFADDVFRTLDRNHNDEITVTELGSWAETAPDMELEMTFGNKQEECAVKFIKLKDGKTSPLAAGFRPSTEGSAIFTIGNQTVQLACYSPRGVYGQVQRVAPLAFPDGGRGFITERDIAGPQYQAIRVLFDMIDRDADGKMMRAEFDAFFNLQRSFTSLPLTLMHSAQTPSLFQVMDSNADGRLSVREIRNSPDSPGNGSLRPHCGSLRHQSRGHVHATGCAHFNPWPALVPQIRPQRRRRAIAQRVPRRDR